MCASTAKKSRLVNPAGEFLLCSRPLEEACSVEDDLMSCFPACVCVGVGVEKVCSEFKIRSKRHTNFTRLYFESKVRPRTRPSSSVLKHKEHSSAVNQRTKATDSSPY